jgi:hypothetical protein
MGVRVPRGFGDKKRGRVIGPPPLVTRSAYFFFAVFFFAAFFLAGILQIPPFGPHSDRGRAPFQHLG